MIHDLHTHSTCSDGQLSPTELVQLALQQGVDELALTDHDTTAGVEQVMAAAKNTTLKVVAGVEFSTVWQGVNIHIVGLNINIHAVAMQKAVTHQQAIRDRRATIIAEKLDKARIPNALEGAKQYANGGVIGRPHFAQYLVDMGHVDNITQAFKRYLGAGKMGDVKNHWPSIATVVEWIHQSGGVAVLAHPDKYALTRTRLYRLLQHFVSVGGEAMEVISGQQDQSVTDQLVQIATKFELLSSCGSDYHGPKYHWQKLGRNLRLPEQCCPVWQQWQCC